MTISTALKDQPSSPADVNLDLLRLDKTKWAAGGDSRTPQGHTARYIYKAGITSYNLELEVSTSIVVDKKDGPKRRVQLKLLIPVLTTDSETSLIKRSGTAEVWQGFAIPVDSADASDMVIWLETTLAIYIPTITSGAAGDEIVDDLMRGTATVLG